ncbi:hypothetical protein JYU34_013873 [Plutella xylostella]|uniref:Uncharacterized protein n=1 Tax=Plutella xylostella TaxID=51655 RepID=A0ABQ7QC69_PLUXY|nr:hypothetical protein JYU34_013873 [Plutella xylostella]
MMYIVYIGDLDVKVRKHVDHLLKYKGIVEDDDDVPYYDCTDVTAGTSIEGEESRGEAAPQPPVGDSGRPVRSTRNPNPRYK